MPIDLAKRGAIVVMGHGTPVRLHILKPDGFEDVGRQMSLPKGYVVVPSAFPVVSGLGGCIAAIDSPMHNLHEDFSIEVEVPNVFAAEWW